MAPIVQAMADLIGNTPLLRLARLAPRFEGELLAKLEWMNPSGSDKDRVARAILDAGEASGALRPGAALIEPTSGNIAYALAQQGVPRGYRVILVMPEAVPEARVELLRALGAEVVLTAEAAGMSGAAARAEQLASEMGGAFRPRQFSNPANVRAQEGCADEIWEACGGQVGALVVGVGTGGTVTGVGRRLKALSGGQVWVVAVEPTASPTLSGGEGGPHSLYGMGAPFVPPLYDPAVVDEVISISRRSCQDTLLRLFRSEGVPSGPTGGAALAAALRLAERPRFARERLVAILPDTMERYLGLPFWQQAAVVMPTVEEE